MAGGGRCIAGLTAAVFGLAAPAHAQDREADSVPEVVPTPIPVPPIIRTQVPVPPRVQPALRPDRVERIGETCQLLKQDPDNGLASALVTVPWRGMPSVELQGAREVQLARSSEREDRGPAPLLWELVTAENSEPLDQGYFRIDRVNDLSGQPTARYYVADDDFAPLKRAVTSGGTIEWRTSEETLAEFPAHFIDTRAEEFTACRENLGRYLKARRAPGGSSSTPIARAKASWITDDDYPSRALRSEETGVVRVSLGVDEYGFVSACEVVQPSGSETLDRASCRLIERRARFYPARNADDEAIPGNYDQTIRWQLPD